MLLLTHNDVARLISPEAAIGAVRAGLAEQAAGLIQVPPRTTIDSSSGHGWLRLMPGIMNGSGLMGFKAMHSTPGVGVRYMVVLYDLASGALLAQMDADLLTMQRTAATVAVATAALARQDAEALGLLGSSEQARSMLRAVSCVRRLKRVKVFSPNPEHREQFARSMATELNLDVEAVSTPELAVAADVACVAIRAGTTPAFKADWPRPGMHINGISSVRPEAREMEDGVWRRADVLVVDDRGHVFESGDGRAAVASGVAPDRAAELWEVLAERRPGRTAPSQISLFKSVGMALQDLSLAAVVYRLAVEQHVGQELGDFPHARK